MKRMDEIFELPAYSFGRIVADNLSAGGVGSFDSADMAKFAAHAINHADALADALEAITSDYNRYTATYPVDLTDDDNAKLHGIMFNASQVLRLYRGEK